jgi:outer membrane protein OmpA-like peptidoglycan-associated protein
MFMSAPGETASASLASSFTDLMTSLAVIFVLLLVAAVSIEQKALHEKQEQLAFRLRGAQDRRLVVEEKLRDGLKGLDLEIEDDLEDPYGVYLIPPRKLEGFELDRHELPTGASDYLTNFAPKLAEVVCAPSLNPELSLVTVEGHADSSGTDAHNLNLSTQRSMEVVKTCLQAVDSVLPDWTQDCFAKLLTASGRGKSEPIKVHGIEDSGRSRRVVFRVRIKTLEEKNLVGNGAA